MEVSEQEWSDSQKALAKKHDSILVQASHLSELNPEGFAKLEEYRKAAETCRATDAKKELADMLDEVKAIRGKAAQGAFHSGVARARGTQATHPSVHSG